MKLLTVGFILAYSEWEKVESAAVALSDASI